METPCYPATTLDLANKVRDCAESCREVGELLTPARLAWLANWTPVYAERAMQTYAGLLNDARRLNDARVRCITEHESAGIDATVEVENFDTLTAAELDDEVVYLADYQG
jgi:hypothetical protein